MYANLVIFTYHQQYTVYVCVLSKYHQVELFALCKTLTVKNEVFVITDLLLLHGVMG